MLNESVLGGVRYQMDQPDIAPQVTCPQCGSQEVYRTKRIGILERVLLYPLGFRAYRCEICDARFRRKIRE
jgi:DNA-directed RNA polymerase subunit RPC12/RpoP